MFQKLQLHVLGVPPPKLRREGRRAVVFPVRERNVGEEEVRLFVVPHCSEAGFSFRGVAAQVSRPLVRSVGVTVTDWGARRRKQHQPSERSRDLHLERLAHRPARFLCEPLGTTSYRCVCFHPRSRPASAQEPKPRLAARTRVLSASAPTLSRLNAGPTEPRGIVMAGAAGYGPATFLAAQDPCPLGWTPFPWCGRAPSFRFNVAGRWAPAMSERDLLEVQPTHAPHVHPPLQGVRSPDCGGRADRGRGRGDRRRTRRGVLRTPRHPAPPGSLVALRGRSGGLTGRSTREDEGDRAVVYFGEPMIAGSDSLLRSILTSAAMPPWPGRPWRAFARTPRPWRRPPCGRRPSHGYAPRA